MPQISCSSTRPCTPTISSSFPYHIKSTALSHSPLYMSIFVSVCPDAPDFSLFCFQIALVISVKGGRHGCPLAFPAGCHDLRNYLNVGLVNKFSRSLLRNTTTSPAPIYKLQGTVLIFKHSTVAVSIEKDTEHLTLFIGWPKKVSHHQMIKNSI